MDFYGIICLQYLPLIVPPLQEVDEHLRQEALLDALAEVLFRNVGDNKKAPKRKAVSRY
jgi:hypothetical protein